MKYLDIRDDVVKPKLMDMLGKAMAENLVNQAHIQTISTRREKQKLHVFVDTVCSDDNFVGMWGKAQAEKQKLEWLGLMR
jgi:hypothetical protein